MSKYLGEKAIFNRLNKYLKSRYTEEQQKVMEFYNDLEGDITWAWKFDLEGKTNIVEIDRFTGNIVHEIF